MQALDPSPRIYTPIRWDFLADTGEGAELTNALRMGPSYRLLMRGFDCAGGEADIASSGARSVTTA